MHMFYLHKIPKKIKEKERFEEEGYIVNVETFKKNIFVMCISWLSLLTEKSIML